MPNKSYQKGYRFQQRVKKILETKGMFVMLSPKSSFPDGIATDGNTTFFLECKMNKYLSKEEEEKGRELMKKYNTAFMVFWSDNKIIKFYALPKK